MIVIAFIVVALVAVCIFVIARWLISAAFAAAGMAVPPQVAGALALLIALLFVLWAVFSPGEPLARWTMLPAIPSARLA